MQSNPQKGFYMMGVWMVPVVLILIEASIFLSRANWQSVYVPYFVSFWVLRAVLSPLIVYYTLRFWIEQGRWKKLFLTHVGGFLLFSVLFWLSAYLVLHNLLHESDYFGLQKTANNIAIFGMIVDNSIATNTIVYVSTVAFCYAWEFLRQNTIINKRANDLERSLLTSRLELLKGQLNTHFLFNTLHTISSLVVRGQNEQANKMLIRLSELLRFSLKENKEQLIPLYREMELLQLYLDIQQTRFKERLEVNLQVQPTTQSALIPSMLLQPLVENAVKYAVEPYTEKGIIDIDIHAVNGTLYISVTDNGRKDFHQIDFNSGIGLTNTKERLQNLYPDHHKFSVQPNRQQGIKVAIEIPNQTTQHAPEDFDS